MLLFLFYFYVNVYDCVYPLIFLLLIILQCSVVVLYLTDDLNPVLDLNMTHVNTQMTRIWRVAALPDGGAFVHNYDRSNDTDQVLRVNVTGQVIQFVHQCVGCYLRGLLVLNNNLYVIYRNGTLLEININNTNTVQVYQVPNVRWMVNQGSLSYHPSVITHPDLLLLADRRKGEIFSYNVTSKNKQVHLTGLNEPTSVSFMTYNFHLYYIVSEQLRDQVLIFNSTWSLYQTLGTGTHGSGDGQFTRPHSSIGLPDGSVIISDYWNHRVCLFTIHSKFVRHILTRSDGLDRPWAMSISLPYLWVISEHGLYRYQLY